MRKISIFLAIMLIGSGCSKKEQPDPVAEVFKTNPVLQPASPSFPGEVSGMADSYTKPGFIWLLQDKDNPAELLTISYNGERGPTVAVTNAENQDWEDMAIGPGPVAGKKYLYIADAGDNFAAFNKYFIYRFEEPAEGLIKTEPADKISFVYEDGLHHDSEAFLVDKDSKDIILVTKEIPSRVFVLDYPYTTTGTNIAKKAATLAQSTITGAAQSPDGKELLLRTYSSMYYWKRSIGQSIISTLQQTPKEIRVNSEPQGESVTFKTDNSGFFTFSENAGLPLQLNLYFYPRK
ncbi:DUF4448 domain-containing protein [Flavihumibacter fluvii]|uniref:DUF4448 domain-containing protein n=1 Tax=Flavihumibacter fluvii TaxID=2838157 RepID=UPI001BDF6253|nr:DUF4448 domain-containing protein [Flavihumibacter fluvii]ULQ54495.1 DUF4448 domain-containing protein [Flavihumibacter fluvii]